MTQRHVALITGSSKGLGKAMAFALGAKGYAVLGFDFSASAVATAKRRAAVEETAEAILPVASIPKTVLRDTVPLDHDWWAKRAWRREGIRS